MAALCNEPQHTSVLKSVRYGFIFFGHLKTCPSTSEMLMCLLKGGDFSIVQPATVLLLDNHLLNIICKVLKSFIANKHCILLKTYREGHSVLHTLLGKIHANEIKSSSPQSYFREPKIMFLIKVYLTTYANMKYVI